MSRLTPDGTAEPVWRDQILRRVRGQGNIHLPCSVDHEQDWQLYPVDPYSAICDDHTYIHTVLLCSQVNKEWSHSESLQAFSAEISKHPGLCIVFEPFPATSSDRKSTIRNLVVGNCRPQKIRFLVFLYLEKGDLRLIKESDSRPNKNWSEQGKVEKKKGSSLAAHAFPPPPPKETQLQYSTCTTTVTRVHLLFITVKRVPRS